MSLCKLKGRKVLVEDDDMMVLDSNLGLLCVVRLQPNGRICFRTSTLTAWSFARAVGTGGAGGAMAPPVFSEEPKRSI